VRLAPFVWGISLVVLCLVVFIFTNPNRQNPYIHFVWQAQAWLDGQTSIATHVAPSATSPGDSWYQDFQPILDASGSDTNRGDLPFPPLPALVLLPSSPSGICSPTSSCWPRSSPRWMLGLPTGCWATCRSDRRCAS